MNSTKIEVLEQAAADATAAHDAERDRLAAAGLNSKARYPLLKPLKAAADAARSRSPWKQTKFDAANAR